MRPERWHEIKRFLDRALEMEPDGRAAWLKLQCGADEHLHNEVASLLEEQESDTLLEAPEPDKVAQFLREHHVAAGVGRRIGKFQVTGVLGHGGMGVVYRATQEHPQREVALKIILASRFSSSYQLRLFRREVQSLARMQHPGIAALFEAGTTEEGQHYFAMELVQGTPLLDCANGRALGLSERLALFTKICHAVHYAHQKGVIHRDLKPSNILVDDEATLQPKLLDFGLAKLIGHDRVTVCSALGNVHGTLSYMSPEQARGSTSEVDIRSDVYSLGVVLFELLTQRLPIDLTHRNVPQAIDMICNERAPRAGTIDSALRGDLEIILAKALEKEAERRYQSANALAEDIERYLTRQPISARPPTALYQIRKFASRHRLPVAFATLLFLVINGSAILATALSIRLARERDQVIAARQSESHARHELEQSVRFLQTIFEQSPGLDEGYQDLTVRELLARLDNWLDSLQNEPQSCAELRESLAYAYFSVGDSHKAAQQLTAALDLRRSLLAGDDLEMAIVLTASGWRFHEAREFEAAEPLFREALEIRRRKLNQDHLLVLESQVCLAEILGHLGRFDEANDFLRRSFQTYTRLKMNQSRHCGFAHIVQGGVFFAAGRPEDAEPAFRRAVQMLDQFGPADSQRLLAGRELGLVLVTLGKFAEADAVLQPVLESYTTVLPGIYDIAWTRMLVGKCRTGLGQFDDAERLLLQAHEEVNKQTKHGRHVAAETRKALVELYTLWRRDDDAEVWRKKSSTDAAPD